MITLVLKDERTGKEAPERLVEGEHTYTPAILRVAGRWGYESKTVTFQGREPAPSYEDVGPGHRLRFNAVLRAGDEGPEKAFFTVDVYAETGVELPSLYNPDRGK